MYWTKEVKLNCAYRQVVGVDTICNVPSRLSNAIPPSQVSSILSFSRNNPTTHREWFQTAVYLHEVRTCSHWKSMSNRPVASRSDRMSFHGMGCFDWEGVRLCWNMKHLSRRSIGKLSRGWLRWRSRSGWLILQLEMVIGAMLLERGKSLE